MKIGRPAQTAWIAQAALIVLPVAILSGVALHYLREDKASIEQDAKNRAYSIAPETARQIGEEITTFLAETRKKGPLTQVQLVNGQTFGAWDYLRWPVPDAWPTRLPPQAAQLWQTARDARFQHPNAESAAKALTLLAEPGNPSDARANASLGLLIAAEPKSDPAALIAQAIAIAQQYPGEVTESGTPVADLALLVALRHIPKDDPPQNLVDAIQNDISLNPSFLSTNLLDSLAAAMRTDAGKYAVVRMRADWSRQEADRASTRSLMNGLYGRFALQKTASLVLYWDHQQRTARPNLALFAPQTGGWRITLVNAEPLRRTLHADLPDYMGATVSFGGERWDLDGRHGGRFVPLAYANGSASLDSKYTFSVILDLRKPDLLYVPYRRRLRLTQGLILAAVAAALLGLWRLWQTYRDQMRLSEMKSNLVSSVSHELRAPIAAVRLMAESLESGRVGGETKDGEAKQKDYYRLIVRECRRLSSLVENVLDFSRIDQGRKQYHFEPLDALALLRHTVMLMEPGAAERRVRLRLIDPPAEFENLQPSWDSEAIEQSMVNLLDNAIKHSPAESEVRVEVELLPTFVRFWVADNGPGIPAEEHQKIFDLFYRYGPELRRETEGVGIGLSIVKHVAEAHGGRVLVESTVGRGSRFGLELPK
jgi:signal transduction histidine kinase